MSKQTDKALITKHWKTVLKLRSELAQVNESLRQHKEAMIDLRIENQELRKQRADFESGILF